MNRLVSIIIPMYNVEEYIEECIASIIEQTYPYLEIILVDDGSVDRTREICEHLCGEDSRIRLFRQENKGVSAAVNTGLQQATGEYIMFVDSDDWIYPDTIEYTIKLLEKECADLVIFDFSVTEERHQQEECINTTDRIGALRPGVQPRRSA